MDEGNSRDLKRTGVTDEVLLVGLAIGDQFVFDGHTYTVSEPPQSIWGVVEVSVEELDWPFQGSDASTVLALGK